MTGPHELARQITGRQHRRRMLFGSRHHLDPAGMQTLGQPCPGRAGDHHLAVVQQCDEFGMSVTDVTRMIMPDPVAWAAGFAPDHIKNDEPNGPPQSGRTARLPLRNRHPGTEGSVDFNPRHEMSVCPQPDCGKRNFA